MTTVIVLAQLVGGALAGMAGGWVFFGGLAATVRRLATTTRPARLVLLSLLGRLAVVAALLLGLVAVGGVALLGGLGGLLAARVVLVRRALGGPEPAAAREEGRSWT